MRARALILAAALVALGGWGAVSLLRPSRPESFVFWRWRAGEPFDSLRARVHREQWLEFICEPIIGPHQLCRLRSPGLPITSVPGALRVVVDSSGIAAAINFRPLIDSTRIRGEARRSTREWKADVDAIAAQWRAQAVAPPDQAWMRDRATRSTWETRDGRFVATLRERDGKPVDLTVADAPVLARIAARSPSAPLILARAGFGGEDFSPLVDAAALGLSTAMFRPSASADVGPVADPSADTPPCEIAPPDTVVPGDSVRSVHKDGILALLADVIPRVHPGARVVAGSRLYFVSAAGAAEEMHVIYDQRRGDGLTALGLYFRRRGGAALSALERSASADAQCRAPAELLLVRHRDGAPPDVARVVIDDEAPWSRIITVEFGGSAQDPSILHVTYETGYASDGWLGTIAWAAAVSDAPARVVTRTPIQYGKRQAGEGTEIGGILAISRPSADTLEVAASDPFGVESRRRVVRLSARDRFSGYRLLGALDR